MDLLLGSEVSGGIVSSQLDVTSQQHLFLLGQNGAHFLSVMHQTQTQIILPDLSAPQSPPSLLIQGSPEGVCLARQQLMVQWSVLAWFRFLGVYFFSHAKCFLYLSLCGYLELYPIHVLAVGLMLSLISFHSFKKMYLSLSI